MSGFWGVSKNIGPQLARQPIFNSIVQSSTAGPPQPDLPLQRRPPSGPLRLDLIWTALFRSESSQNQVRIRSGRGVSERVGSGGVGLAVGVPVAPPESLYNSMKMHLGFQSVGFAFDTQRETQGQQLKGKIGSALFRTFWQLSTHFHTFFQSFSEFFLQDILLESRGFTAVLVQR